MKKFMQKSRLGFTLIELLIVIVIIGILSVAFLPTVLNAPKKARDNTRKAHINAILQAIQTEYSVNATNPPADTKLYDTGDVSAAALAKKFPNNTLPKDPDTGAAYDYKYTANSCIAVSATVELKENANSKAKASAIDCTKDPKTIANNVATDTAGEKNYVVTLSLTQ